MRTIQPAVFTLFLVLITLVGMAGCASSMHKTGRPIEDSKVVKIVKGTTTVEDVISAFGAPTTQSEVMGNILYTYKFTQTKGKTIYFPYVTSGDSEEESDELTITFDKNTGTVKAYGLQRGIGKSS